MRHLRVLPILFVAAATPLLAQERARDGGRLVVRIDDVVIGEEEFSLEVVEDGDETSVNVVVAAAYPPDGTRRAAATFSRRRITVRIAAGGTEVAREYPRGDRALIVHDGLLGLLAIAGRLEPGPVTLFAPGGGGRRTGSLHELGAERLSPGGAVLRRLALRGGDADVELWFDAEGRLMRIAIPSRRLLADRKAGS